MQVRSFSCSDQTSEWGKVWSQATVGTISPQLDGWILEKHHLVFIQSSTVQFWCPLKPQIEVPGWQECYPMWSSVVVAYLPQGSICCTFWHALLLTTFIKCGYFSYCSLPALSNQSGLFLLCSQSNQMFDENWSPWPVSAWFSSGDSPLCIVDNCMNKPGYRWTESLACTFS